jgi:hypothetical protein
MTPKNGGYAMQVDIYAGRKGNDIPFEVAHATNLRTFDTFIDDVNACESGVCQVGHGDIGLVTLDYPLGDYIGWFGQAFHDDDYFTGHAMETAGCPGGEFDTHLVHGTGTIDGESEGKPGFGVLKSTVPDVGCRGGSSGSAVWDPENRQVFGVFMGGDGTAAYREQITVDVFNTLCQWMDEDAPNPPPSR